MTNSFSKFSDNDIFQEAQRRAAHAKKLADDAKKLADDALRDAQLASQREQAAQQREQNAIHAHNQALQDLQASTQRELAATTTASTLQSTVSDLRLDQSITPSILSYTALKAGDAVSLTSAIFYSIPNNANTTRLQQLQAIGDRIYTFRNKLRPNRMGNFHFRDEKAKAFDTLCDTIFHQLRINYNFRLSDEEKSQLLSEDPALLSPNIRRRKLARDAKRSSRMNILALGGEYR